MAIQKKSWMWISFFAVLLGLFFVFMLFGNSSSQITGASISILNSGSGSSCGGINTTTLLTQNVNSTRTCFTINASNIVLDCRGFEINYSTDGIIGYGVLNDGFDNVTIQNCVVHEGTTTGNGKHAIQLSNGSVNNTVFNNTLRMLGVDSQGIYALQYSNYTNISENIINITGGSIAILVADSSYNNVYYNAIITTGTTGEVRGISLINAAFNNIVLANNITVTSIGYGLRIFLENGTIAPDNNVFYNNTVSNVQDFVLLDEGLATNNNTLIYDGPFGSINWTLGNLTTNLSLIVGTTIFIQNNTIGVIDSPYLLQLNQSSRKSITFKSQGYATTPYVFKAGVRCDHNAVCNITYNSVTATLTANVSSFSNYTTQANLLPNVTNAVPILNSIFNTSQSIEIGVNVTDDGGIVSMVLANITYPNSSLFQYVLSNSTGHPQRYNMTFVIPRLTGVYNITFMANDSANVMNSTQRTNFTAFLTCGEVRHTSLLSQNVTSTGTCFTINSSNIILDCQGYQINYSSDGTSGSGVNNNGGFRNVTVQNCVILEGTSTTNSKHGISYSSTSNTENGTIYNNTITMTGSFSNAISLSNANRTNISANTLFVRSDASGIMISPSSFHSIYFNRIHISTIGGTAVNGIALSQPSFSNYVLANNITLEDSGTGIYVFTGSANNIFANNTIYTRSGITIDDDNTVTNNTLIYEGNLGTINWTSANLTTNLSLIVGTTIFLENNTVGVADSLQMERLNTSARITMRGLTHSSTPQLLKAGTQCDGTLFCNISYDSGTGVLTANVSSFSNYTTVAVARGSALLSIDIINLSGGSSSLGGGFVVSSTDGKVANGSSLTYAAFDPTGLSRLNLSGIININVSLIANSSHGNYVNVTFGWQLAKSNRSIMLNRTVYNNTLNQTAFNLSFNTNLLPDGIYNISVYVQNVSTDAAFSPDIVVNYSRGFDIAIDRTPPNVTTFGMNISNATTLVGGAIQFNLTANDSTTSVQTVLLGFTSSINSSQFNVTAFRNLSIYHVTIQLSTLSDAAYTVRIYVNDSLGNVNNSVSNLSFSVDMNAPTLTIVAPQQNQNYTGAFGNQTFHIRPRDTISAIDSTLYSFDNASGTGFNITPLNLSGEWSSSYDLSTLAQGSHVITILVNDSQGHYNRTETIIFNIDNLPPNVTSLTLNNFTDFVSLSPGLSADFASLNATVNDSTTTVQAVFFEINSTNGTRFNVSASLFAGRWNATINLSLLTESVHSALVYANDTLGNINNSQYVTFLVNRTNQVDAGSGSGSGNGGGSGGGGGAGGTGSIPEPVLGPGCQADSDCGSNEYCAENECRQYQCLVNSDCREGLYCVDHACSRVFDLKIIDLVIDKGEIHFTYGMKNILQDEGDALMQFSLLDADEKAISSGSDVIFVGAEEVVETARLFFTSSILPGEYTVQIKLTFRDYSVVSYRTFSISAQEIVKAPEKVPGPESRKSNLFGQAIGASSLFGFFTQYFWLMLILISIIIVSSIMVKKAAPRKSEMDLLESWVRKALSHKKSKEDIHMMLERHGWPELKIHLAIERMEAVQQLEQKYTLSISQIDETTRFIRTSARRGVSQADTILSLQEQGWDRKLIEQLVIAYYVGG